MKLFSTTFSRFRSGRRFAFALTAFVFAATSVVFAASWEIRAASAADANADALSPIAPFVNSKTLCVARVNFSGIDFDRLGETFDAVFSQILTNAGVSEESVDASRTEFAKTLAASKKIARESFDRFQTTVGLNEAFFIVQNAKGEGLAVVVPVDGLTSEQTTFLKMFSEANDWNCAVYKKKFLVASPTSLKDFGAYYKAFSPERNVDRDKFFAENQDKLLALYCVPFRIRTILDAATGGESKMLLTRQPQAYRAALEVFDSSISEIKAVVDANSVVARAEFRFTSAVASGQMRSRLEKLIDAIVDAQFGEALKDVGSSSAFSRVGLSDEQVERFNLVPFVRETRRGTLRAWLPRQEGDRLVFDFDFVDLAKKNGINGSAVIGALFLPAIQAARSYAPLLKNRRSEPPFAGGEIEDSSEKPKSNDSNPSDASQPDAPK